MGADWLSRVAQITCIGLPPGPSDLADVHMANAALCRVQPDLVQDMVWILLRLANESEQPKIGRWIT